MLDKEIEANKRKQQEMVLKGRTESLKAALGTLILGGKKVLINILYSF